MSARGYKRTITLDFDYTQVKKGTAEVGAQMRLLDSEFKKSSQEVKLFGEASQQTAIKKEMLTQKIGIQSKNVEDLKKHYEKLSSELGESNKTVVNAKIKYNDAEVALNHLQNELVKTNKELAAQQTAFGAAATKIDDMKAAAERAGIDLDKMADSFIKIGSVLTGVGVVASKMYMDFENGAIRAYAVADKSVVTFDALKDTILDVSDEFGIAAGEVAKASEELLQANVPTENLNLSLKQTAILAKTSGVAMDTAGDVITTFTNAFRLSAEEQTELVDKLTTAQLLGKVSMQELASSAGDVAGMLKASNVSYEEYLAVLAAMTAQGMATSTATHSLNQVISNIIKPTKEASEKAQELGIQFNAAALKANGLDGFLNKIQKSTRGNAEDLSVLFGSVRGLGEVMALTGPQREFFKESLDAINNSAGATQEQLDVLNQAAGSKLNDAMNKLSNALIKAGEAFAPVIDAIASFVSWLGSLPPGVYVVIAVIGALLLIIGTGIKIFTGFSTALKTINTIMGLVAPAATAATAANTGLSVSQAAVGATGTVASVGLGSILIIILAITAAVAVLMVLWAALTGKLSNTDKMKNDINDLQSSLDGIQAKAQNVPSYAQTGRNASGTNYWRGGLTSINETGAEIYDLPKGTRIIPHGLSMNMAQEGKGSSTIVNKTYNYRVDFNQFKELLTFMDTFEGFGHDDTVWNGV